MLQILKRIVFKLEWKFKRNLVYQKNLRRLLYRRVDGLTEEQMNQFRTLLLEYRDVFALQGQPLGKTDWVKHEINVVTALPIKQAP